MNLDFNSLLVASILATSLAACGYVIVWLRVRRETGILWMVAATVLGCTGATLRELLPETTAIFASNISVFLSLGSVGAACRVLGGRAPKAPWLIAPSCIWVAACAVPFVLNDVDLRVALASGIVAILMLKAVVELHTDLDERLASRLGLMVPLVLNGAAAAGRAMFALVTRGDPRPGLLSGHDMAAVTLWSLAFLLMTGFGVVALVLERSELRLRRSATRDGLTGLANRQQFDITLSASLNKAARLRQPLALLMIDVDEFKGYNDLYGHLVGDDCLRAVANVLATTFPDTSVLTARYGGEEFAMVLSNSGASQALRFGERVRQAIRDLAIDHPGSKHGIVTVSVGVSFCHPDAMESTVTELLSTADRNLYAAKRLGRDRVEPGAHAQSYMN
jgi:diguanylate cyclase (GGDEF)-like protein